MPDEIHRFYTERIVPGSAMSEDLRQFVDLLWRRHGQAVFLRLLARVRDREVAADICQDVFLKAHSWLCRQEVHRADGINFAAWLHRIAYHRFLTWLRRKCRDPVTSEHAVDLDVTKNDPDPLAVLSQQERAERVRRCLAELDAEVRALVMQRFFDNVKPLEIAADSHLTANHIRVKIHRAVTQLRGCLEWAAVA